MPSLDNVNSFFETRRDQFENNIFARYWTSDSYAGLIESKPFELEMGLTPTVVTAEHELPQSYLPLTQNNLTLDTTGTGNGACVGDPITIGGGYTNRTFTIQQWQFETEAFCLTDLQFKFQWEQQARFREKGIGDWVTQFMADWHRIYNIGMINAKLSTTSAGGFTRASNSDFNFSGVAVPTTDLTWAHLQLLYDELNQIGAQQNAVGMSDGTPVYALNVGPGIKRRLFQGNTLVRTSVDFLDMGKEYSRNFKARGIDTAIYGFIPNVDLLPVRYDSGLQPIYPFVNVAATKGTKASANSAYRTVANGGNAVYEVVTVMARGVYSRRPRPVGPLQAGMEAFNPVTYSGEVRWINNPDMGTNKLGNFGFYHVDIQQAAMPEFPQLGYAIITLAVDAV